MKRLPVLLSFVLFITLCVSLTFWAMQLFKPTPRAVTAVPVAPVAETDLHAAAGLFGGASTIAVASNFQLKGVVQASNERDSVAILSANGKPAQSVRQGAEIVPGAVVKEVHRRYVLVSDGGVPKRVELPETAPASAALNNPTGATWRPPAAASAVPQSVVPAHPIAPGITFGAAAPIQQTNPVADANANDHPSGMNGNPAAGRPPPVGDTASPIPPPQ